MTKKFLEPCGFTCKNWRWSWSFVNHKKKKIVFRAWRHFTKAQGKTSLILSEKWKKSRKGRKTCGYPEARENLRLIEEKNYSLMILHVIDANRNRKDNSPAKIQKTADKPKLLKRSLRRKGNHWFARDIR